MLSPEIIGREVWRDVRIVVSVNDCGEVYITSMLDGSVARVGPYSKGLIVTAALDVLTPWMSNGLPAFTVCAKR